ncbi:hypothetical protein EZS27_022262 [termite gut metagenome]|uniref:SPOR domain-containing protein n=1 Tax=termite gut metagenome TaxID=433724 RepID=A0A5J4R893_9ZZZZ
MTELAHHIEVLLLENDCVVVPELGGFITHYAPAQRVDREKIFFPPIRTIGFNPKLKINDGLLVQSYMKKHNVSFPDATQMIKKEAEELVSCLHEKGKVDLSNVGEIHYTLHDTYEFTPYNNKIVTPHLFGLEPFEMKELSELNRKNYATKQSGILLSFLRYAVATAAVAFVFLFLSPPVENTAIEERNYAQLFCSDIFKHSLALAPVTLNKQAEDKSSIINPQTPPAVTATTENKDTVVEEPVSKPVVEESKEKVKLKTTASKAKKTNIVKTRRYHIITLSGNSQTTQKTLKILKKEGYSHAKIMDINGKKCISVMSFSTQEDAYRKLLLFRRAEAYKNARIVPIRS